MFNSVDNKITYKSVVRTRPPAQKPKPATGHGGKGGRINK